MGDVVEIGAALTAKQQQGLLLLAEGLSCGEVAARLKLSPQTIYNWRSSDAKFRRELDLLQRDQYEAGLRALRSSVYQAATLLSQVMSDPAARDSDRIAAARTVLQFGGAAATLADPSSDEAPDEMFEAVAEEIAQLVKAGAVGK